ncbi:ArnT family glycosyltransferase [Domibacillus epiphyticus]|uniref:Glycosyltransferase RgtA/B/C/D-like domain-containing protein n=1 Tax=Domibacillus epiphyticus TaxID=1714355 RepID=A0A1V2A6T5_9BACI|nr:glycosyltransferase family 39 protein [Domibacillus epiphyticus]OMP66647.1 hypothetical protein BTO28_11430 [Domibacillus epiphyticus]
MKEMLKKQNWWLWAPIGIGLAVRLLFLYVYGPEFTLDSDDRGYLKSARFLLEEGRLIYVHEDEPTVHIMPGLPFLLASVFFIFGSGAGGLFVAKIVMIFFGCLVIAGVYKLGEILFSKAAGSAAALLTALYIPQIVTDNLTLTEAPFTAAFIWFIYFSIKLAHTHRQADFYWVIGLYLFMLMFRPTIALVPFLLLGYFVLTKYPLRKALKQFIVAFILLLVVLGPWWIRNYMAFDEFIPLSGGAGNPMLLGTYQGHGHKYGPPADDIILELEEAHPEATRYVQNQYQMEAAKERISVMWNHNRDWFIDTYTWIKLRIQWEAPFYWFEAFHISSEMMRIMYLVLFWTGLVSFIGVFAYKYALWKEGLLLSSFFIYFSVLNNIFFAYPRYNQPLLPLLFLTMGGLVYVLQKRKRRRQNV